MHKKLLEDLAITDGIYDCICDPYDKFKTGDYYGSVMWDLERFAEKIVRICAEEAVMFNNNLQSLSDKEIRSNANRVGDYIKQHFGIEE